MDIAFMDDPCATLDLPRSSRETPKLIVYYLDDTIWFPELYMIAGAPFVKDPATKKTTDASGVEVRVYPAARASISLVDTHEAFSGTKIAVASRTHRGQWARTLMSMFDIADDGARSLAQCVSLSTSRAGQKRPTLPACARRRAWNTKTCYSLITKARIAWMSRSLA